MKKPVTKLLAFAVIYLTAAIVPSAQAQLSDWLWAKSPNGIGDESGVSAVDAAGNVYNTGSFYGTVDFDPGAGSYFLNGGANSMFIFKLNSTGGFKWAGAIGGATGLAITTDASGVYITGTFEGTTDFDPGPATYNLTSTGSTNAFICKFDNLGNFIWVKAIEGSNDAFGYSIALDAAGNIYTSGHFKDTADFDPGAGVYNLTTAGSTDIYISKLDNTGNFIWARRMGGTGYEYCNALTLDDSANVYTTGGFQGTVDFDPNPLVIFNLVAGSGSDVYISKLDSSGNFVWAKKLGGIGLETALSITHDASGNIYTTGNFLYTCDFDPDTSAVFNLTSVGADIFICKLDAAGNFIWAKQMGGTQDDSGSSIAIDAQGTIYVAGTYAGTADFDPDTSATFNLTSAGSTDIFITKSDSSGNFVWARSIGGTNYEAANTLAIDGSDVLYFTGYFASTAITLDPVTLTNSNTAATSIDFFVAKLSACQTSTAINPAACFSYVSPSGNYTWATSGTYYDTIPNAAGCDSVITINLTVNTINTLVTQNGVILIANQNGATYQWLDCNNGYAPIGIISQVFTATAVGNYAVAITLNGCTDTSVCYTVTNVGINETDAPGAFWVYPNPVADNIIISFKETKGHLTIYNTTGNKISEFDCTNDQNIDMRSLTPGIYYIEVNTSNGLYRKKVVKL